MSGRGFEHVDPLWLVVATGRLTNVPATTQAWSWQRVAMRYHQANGHDILDGWSAVPPPPPPNTAKLDALLDAFNALDVGSVTIHQHDGWTSVSLTVRNEDGAAGVERLTRDLGAPPPRRVHKESDSMLATEVSPDESLAISITGDWRTR